MDLLTMPRSLRRIDPRQGDGIWRIPGVGLGAVRKLRTAGVTTIGDLLEADLDQVAEETGIDRPKLQRWREIADLMRGGRR